jgi:hypothetical protein
MIRKKNNNYKNEDRSWYKNQILRDKIENKSKNQNKIYNQKINDQIWYNQRTIIYF